MRYLFLLIIFYSLSSIAQKKVDIDGALIVTGNVSGDSVKAKTGYFSGLFPLESHSPFPTCLKLFSSDPMIEFRNPQDEQQAFIQSISDQFYVANVKNGKMYFRTSNISRMVITEDGNVGIGIASPNSKLTINGFENNGTVAGLQLMSGSQIMLMDGNEIDCSTGPLYLNYNSQNDVLLRTSSRRADITLSHESGSGNGGQGVAILNDGSNNAYWTLYSTNGDGNLELYYKGTLKGEFSSSSGNYSAISDRRAKANIRPFVNVLERVKLARPSIYTFQHDDSQKPHLGFIAQEFGELFPEVVNKGTVGDSNQEFYTMDYGALGVIAIAGLREMASNTDKEAITELKKENELLKQQLLLFERRLHQLEKRIPN